MGFALDAPVVVESIGKTGRVVGVGRGGRYRVRVGSVVIACREEDLHEAAGDRTRNCGGAPAKRPDLPGREAPPALSVSQAERRRLASLDLHGATVEEALRRVEDHVDRALRAGLDSIDLIHGRSSGRIKAAVHRLLAELSAVRRFEVTPANPGVTRVFF